MKTEEELRKLFYNYASAHIEIGYCETEPVLEIDSFIELMKELKFLNLHDVSVSCEHNEMLMQGNGFTYTVCSKCGADLD